MDRVRSIASRPRRLQGVRLPSLWSALEKLDFIAGYALSSSEKRLIGRIALASAPLLIFLPAASFVLVLGACLWVWHARRESRARHLQQIHAELPLAVDLLRLGVESGMNVTHAVTRVTEHTEGPLSEELRKALDEVARGCTLAATLDDVPARTSEDVRPLIWALTASERYGAPLSDVLDAVAYEVRLDQERRAERASKRLTVQLLFPVAVTTLPAFALLTVAPLLAGTLETLASSFQQ